MKKHIFKSFLLLTTIIPFSSWYCHSGTFIIAYILLTKFHVIVLVVKALSMPELLYCFAWDASNPKELVTFGEMLSSVCRREEEDWMKLFPINFFCCCMCSGMLRLIPQIQSFRHTKIRKSCIQNKIKFVSLPHSGPWKVPFSSLLSPLPPAWIKSHTMSFFPIFPL